jgi:hypothetical protein
MNSYNENLNATVVASLQSLDLNEKNLKSQLNASMFTLYHAEGATITANDKLSASKDDLKFKNSVKQIAVINTNISNNLVSSATQADQYLKQAVTNAAVGASNVQIAANAIVRLASDIGSIFSIVNAADFDTDIFHQADHVRNLMNDTAYDAEVGSQISMDASKLTSEVSSSAVLDRAKSTNASIKDLLKIASADYDTASQTVNADNATQATISADEKVAEGALEDLCIDYLASKVAYYSTNDDLNLNLTVNSDAFNDSTDEDLNLMTGKKLPALSFNVSFNVLKSPFPPFADTKRPAYPVESYAVFVVKESKKLTFSVSNAETLLLSDIPKQYIPFVPPVAHPAPGVSAPVVPQYNGLRLSADKSKISGPIYFESIIGKDETGANYTLQDTDGDDITIGVDYVVFVMASYYNDYKKLLNNFDDFMSAPSKSFCVKNELQAVGKLDISVAVIDKTKNLDDIQNIFTAELGKSNQNEAQTGDSSDDQKPPAYSMQLKFSVKEYPENMDKVSYRCIFLPEPADVAKGLLTKSSLKSLIDIEYIGLKSVEEDYDTEVSTTETRVSKIEVQQRQATTDHATLEAQLADFQAKNPNPEGDQAKELASLKASLKASNNLLTKHEKDYKDELAMLTKLKMKKVSTLNKLVAQRHSIPGFFFNLPLAEQVSAGNYLPTVKAIDENAAKAGTADLNDHTNKLVQSKWTAFIGPDATDNFGNLLIANKSYIPVIVTIATVNEDKQEAYANAISDFETTKIFEYIK